MQGEGSSVPIFDFSTANVFTKKLAFDVLYDTGADGTKTNPHVDVPIFSLGGLPFRVFTGTSDDAKYPFLLGLSLDSATKEALASGWTIDVFRTFTSRLQNGKLEEISDTLREDQLEAALSRFNTKVVHYDIDIKLKFEDIFPHRLRFKSAALADVNLSDCKIVLEDKEDSSVHVHKTTLAMDSPFFRTLFFGEFKEKDEDVIKLSEVTETEFLEYLYCVYSPNRPFAFKRLDTLLRLADKYQNDVLMASIQKFLLDKTKTPMSTEEKHKMLAWGDAYRMPALFRETLEKMDKADLKALGKDTYNQFRSENKTLLINRLLEC